MASTRDINSQGNYMLEQRGIQNIRDNLLFLNAPNGHAYNPAFPELYNHGRVPSNVLSCNPVDIESALLGIDANNLVNPREPTVAKIKHLPKTSFFEKPKLVTGKSVKPDDSQRPFIFR